MPHGGRRSADDRLLALLACGVTVEAAAQQAGVGAATVYRRLKDRRFRRRLQQVRADLPGVIGDRAGFLVDRALSPAAGFR